MTFSVNITGSGNWTCVLPLTPWYVAVISASPGPMPVTTPALPTMATDAFVEPHAARPVTVWVVPFDNVAVALNWLVVPTDDRRDRGRRAGCGGCGWRVAATRGGCQQYAGGSEKRNDDQYPRPHGSDSLERQGAMPSRT